MNESNNYWEPEPSELERAVKEAHLQPKKIKELLEKTKRIERSFPPSDNLQISIYRQLIVINRRSSIHCSLLIGIRHKESRILEKI